MPFVKLTTMQDLRDLRDLGADMWPYLRNRIEGISLPDFTVPMLLQLRENGYEAAGYRRAAAGGRLDGACIYRIVQAQIAPSREPEPWLQVSFMLVRPSALPTTAEREKALLLAIKDVVVESVQQHGAVGIFAEFDARWTDLHDFLTSWPKGQTAVDEHGNEKWWSRHTPGLPDLTARVAPITPD